MKFLRTMHLNSTFFSLSEEKQLELVKAHTSVAGKYQKEGKLKENYFTGDWKSAYSIWDVSSHEELTRYTMEDPLASYFDFDTCPLVENQAVVKMWKKPLETAPTTSQKVSSRSR
jgi:muconolactone delta-isomerase